MLLAGHAKQVTIRNEMERTKFEALVAQALDNLPKTFREKLTNVAIIVEGLAYLVGPVKVLRPTATLLKAAHGSAGTRRWEGFWFTKRQVS
ncbi:MAG: hypothetical protein DMG26_01270 [Acidobacteria bacterium]|nr:MAG: hypothetical protein DMG26_01270 [Acidobacteriota bacterium]